MPKKSIQGFAIVRIDDFDEPSDSLQDRITVKRVVWHVALAISEVARLNDLNSDKGCQYFWQTTRVDAIEDE